MDFIYKHIENVMSFLGVEHYFYEAVFQSVAQEQSVEIDAYNEFYFLVGAQYRLLENQRGFTLILAENTLAELDSETHLTHAVHTDHFTGKISISLNPYGYVSGEGNLQNPLNGKCLLNFIRVTPTVLFSHENPRQ